MIVALTDRHEIVLAEEFRPPMNAPVVSLPSGLIGDEGPEDAIDAARRELAEETGPRGGELGAARAGPGLRRAELRDDHVLSRPARPCASGTQAAHDVGKIRVHVVPRLRSFRGGRGGARPRARSSTRRSGPASTSRSAGDACGAGEAAQATIGAYFSEIEDRHAVLLEDDAVLLDLRHGEPLDVGVDRHDPVVQQRARRFLGPDDAAELDAPAARQVRGTDVVPRRSASAGGGSRGGRLLGGRASPRLGGRARAPQGCVGRGRPARRRRGGDRRSSRSSRGASAPAREPQRPQARLRRLRSGGVPDGPDEDTPAATRPTTAPSVHARARTVRRRRARPASGSGAGVQGRASAPAPSGRARLLRALQGLVDQAHATSPSSSRIAWRTARPLSS